MSVSEHDLELLETLLDGELPVEEAEVLRQRLSCDPQLAAAMDQLRGERDLRQQVWRAGEPDDAQVASLISSVQREIRRDEIWTRRARALRYVSGLAACIAVGFFLGRFLPYGATASGPDRGSGVVFEDPSGPVQEVIDTNVPMPQAGNPQQARPGQFKVLLTDSLGRVIAEQHFNTFDEAREFTEDLNRLQTRSRPMRVSDTIFTRDQF